MAAKKYLVIATGGRVKQVAGVVTSAGAGNDGDLVALDASGKLDASVIPTGFGQNTTTGTVSGSLAANDLVYINGTGQVLKADATSEGKEAVGFVKTSYTTGQTATVYLSGNVITGLSGLTPGAYYYMSTTAGAVAAGGAAPATGGATGNVVMAVGIALSATTLSFEPDTPVTLA